MSNSSSLRSPKPLAILTYGVAVLSVTAALIIAWWMEFVWQSAAHVSLFLCAVMFSAWFGGIRPGLLAIVFSVLAFDYYFLALEPRELPRLLFFAVAALFVGSLSAAQRSTAESLRRARDDLDQTVQELKRINEALQAENAERKQAEEALGKAQAELAHVTRVTTLGEMTASIAHEINQPLAAVVNNASACLRWLVAHNLEEARQSAALIITDGHRTGEIISRIRALAKKAPPQKDWVYINETIRDVIALARSEVQKNRVSLQTQLSDDLPLIVGDRIQLQQVILNLIINAIEAMSENNEGPRELLVSSRNDDSQGVRVAVRDSGPGLDLESLNHIFTAFYTTKPHGMGMGLAISRSIIQAHGGRLWATADEDRGAVFQFTLSAGSERPS
jgi:C4-dicarboxylate-specific signal transduction histidine kinase